jgi:hypothetical protein
MASDGIPFYDRTQSQFRFQEKFVWQWCFLKNDSKYLDLCEGTSRKIRPNWFERMIARTMASISQFQRLLARSTIENRVSIASHWSFRTKAPASEPMASTDNPILFMSCGTLRVPGPWR